ncbi:MAG: hypothetical protein WC792_03545 [Candidatus Micrarchaeia archaeon]
MENNYLPQALVILAIISSIAGTAQVLESSSALDAKIAGLAPIAPVLPKIQITVLAASSCTDCFDLSGNVSEAKSAGVNVTEEKKVEYDSAEGKALVSKYSIKKVPAFVITGETSGASLALSDLGTRASDGAIVFDKQAPVYIDTATGEAKGRVAVTLLQDSSCGDCAEYSSIIGQLSASGVKISNTTRVEYSDEAGKRIISQYNISKVPSIILSKGAADYEFLAAGWSNVGDVAADGSLVLRKNTPPYRDVARDEIAGRVKVVYLSDESCKECYDPSMHKPILIGFGLKVVDEKNESVQSSEGKLLVSKYNVTAVPTILVSPDAAEYGQFMQVWAQVGSVEKDGWLVFREVGTALQGKAGVYKDLSTGKQIPLTPTPVPSPAANAS